MNTQLIILGIILLFVIFYIWSVYNGLATGKVRIKEALSEINVQLKRRIDLIPNLVETVKGYAKHEKEIFQNVTKARSSLLKADTLAQKAKSDNMLSGALKTLFAVSENYPNLRASENFKELQEELEDTENKVAYSRQFYNTNVRDYNTTLANFPSSFIGQLFNFTPEEFFQTDEEAKKPIKVSF